MKKTNSQKTDVFLEHLSVTLSKHNQDTSGKQTSHRTYCSVLKKEQLVLDDSTKTMAEKLSGTKTYHQSKQRKSGRSKKYIQMNMFPETK